MALEITSKDELNIIFSNLDSPKHILHLYSPRIDKYNIFNSFFSNEETGYVSSEDSTSITKHFNPKKQLTIIHPHQMSAIKNYKRILVDASTIKPQQFNLKKALRQRKTIGLSVLESEYLDMFSRENYLNKLKGEVSILCAYDITQLDRDTLRKLIAAHEKLILSSPVEAIQDNSPPSPENFNPEKIGEFVKNELEPIVLALVMQKPVCGQDIKEIIYKKFNIFLSSGTLYPLLHELEKKDLLRPRVGFKSKKMYYPADENGIIKILNEHVQVKNFLNGFLRVTVKGEIERERERERERES